MQWLSLCLVIAGLCAASGVVSAQDQPSRTLARNEFQRGLAMARSGDLDAAVRAFEGAYEASPNYAVLYNIGQAYSGLGKPVEAVNAFERFLRDGADRIDPARRREVEELVSRQRGRIGYFEIAVTPKDAEVFVDGQRTDPGSLGARAVATGRHLVAARKLGYVSRFEAVEVRANDTVRSSLQLQAETANAEGSSIPGQLTISCDLPAVEVSVDGTPRGRTPFDAPLLVPVGTRTVRLARTGYRTVETSLAVAATQPARLACPMTVDIRGTKPGRLKVTPSEPFAQVRVDGAIYNSAALPSGQHLVQVERAGFRPWKRVVTVDPGGVHSIVALLEPTPEHLAEFEARERHDKYLAFGIGATGVVLAGTAIALFGWNGTRYDDWRAQTDGAGTASRAAELQRTDDVAAGTAVLGAAALVAAGVIWLTSEHVGSQPRPSPKP